MLMLALGLALPACGGRIGSADANGDQVSVALTVDQKRGFQQGPQVQKPCYPSSGVYLAPSNPLPKTNIDGLMIQCSPVVPLQCWAPWNPDTYHINQFTSHANSPENKADSWPNSRWPRVGGVLSTWLLGDIPVQVLVLRTSSSPKCSWIQSCYSKCREGKLLSFTSFAA